ncbi:hypothetical protein HK405_008193 [Cladochytrium tenue]|nr:hypothetical protein HK405_008193 [Cladochytrium tenue]
MPVDANTSAAAADTLVASLLESTGDATVAMRDPAAVRTKLAATIAAGPGALHIISGLSFRDRSEALYQRYYPIEINSSLSMEVRRAAMEEWWRQAHEVIVDAKLSREEISRLVLATPVPFRQGTRELIAECDTHGVPFLVFSAGLYDVITEILVQASLKSPNVHVVSNRMRFDESGVCIGFHTPLIHVFNKNEANTSGSPYAETLRGRPNVILLGDSIGDLQMAEGLQHSTLLTIGLLNHDVDRLLPSYLEAFDIVILNDGPLDFPIQLLAAVVRNSATGAP